MYGGTERTEAALSLTDTVKQMVLRGEAWSLWKKSFHLNVWQYFLPGAHSSKCIPVQWSKETGSVLQDNCKSDNNHLQMNIITEELWLEGTPASRAGLTSKSNQAKGHCPSNFALSFPKNEIPQSPLAAVLLLNHTWWQNIFLLPRMCFATSCWLLPLLETALPPSPSWASTKHAIAKHGIKNQVWLFMMWLQGRPTRCQQPSRSCPGRSCQGEVKIRESEEESSGQHCFVHLLPCSFLLNPPFPGQAFPLCNSTWGGEGWGFSNETWILLTVQAQTRTASLCSILHLSKDTCTCREKMSP